MRPILNRLITMSAFAVLGGFLSIGSAKAVEPSMIYGSLEKSYTHILSHSNNGNIVAVNTGLSDQVSNGAESFIDSMASDAIAFLSNGTPSQSQKKEYFRKLLGRKFDMKTIGRFTLGRYWRVSTPQQRTEYQKLFENMVIDVYSSRFSEYEGQRFETRGHRTDGTKDVIVTSFVIPEQGPEIQVDWRVRYKKGVYKVVDVLVEGVSMSVTQRSDFAAVIQRGGGNVSVLIDHLSSL